MYKLAKTGTCACTSTCRKLHAPDPAWCVGDVILQEFPGKAFPGKVARTAARSTRSRRRC